MACWRAGCKNKTRKLSNHKISNYSKDRNDPILEGTSRISPYLAAGVISNRCLLEALKLNNFELQVGNKGICKWIDEIIWREFSKILCIPFQE